MSGIALTGLLSCGSALPQDATVRRVIDGDTVALTDGQLLRYIGIDAPELRRRDGDRWVEVREPLGQEATALNRQLVEGKRVRLEYDVQTHDRFGRILAYVYIGDVMVNGELLRAGLARLLTIPPNVKYVERFRALLEEARRAHRGLWAPDSARHGPRDLLGAGDETRGTQRAARRELRVWSGLVGLTGSGLGGSGQIGPCGLGGEQSGA
ncbi:MAG: thermonuclease family protein [Candidatus Omnitrophica bacterium]|nr:thermonuclease family protein [Candidatus Omnitrophota bacterium]